MVSFKTGGLRLLPAAAALISSAAARCTPCGASDKLLMLFRAQDQSEVAPFCAAFLGTPVSTAEVTVTVTPTTVASVTTTVVVTEVSTVFEEIITVTVPAPAPAPAPTFKAKRSVEYPEWLAPTYNPARVSSACQCLSNAPSAASVTVTATAEAVTVTEDATVTETTTSTLVTIGVVTVTQTATPSPVPQNLKAKIAVHRKSTGDRVGYLSLSSNPLITTNVDTAFTVDITVPDGATTATMLRLIPAGSNVALGLELPASRELRNYYGAMVAADTPTPPGSSQVVVGNKLTAYETDIWTVNTETKLIGWEWIAADGTVSSSITLYRLVNRMWSVGNFASFDADTGGPHPLKYEIMLKYEIVAE